MDLSPSEIESSWLVNDAVHDDGRVYFDGNEMIKTMHHLKIKYFKNVSSGLRHTRKRNDNRKELKKAKDLERRFMRRDCQRIYSGKELYIQDNAKKDRKKDQKLQCSIRFIGTDTTFNWRLSPSSRQCHIFITNEMFQHIVGRDGSADNQFPIICMGQTSDKKKPEQKT